MFLNEFLNFVDNKIIEGGDCNMDCYPDNTRYIDSETKFGWASCYYDPITTEVYDVCVSSSLHVDFTYRWINPEYENSFNEYQKTLNNDISWRFTQDEIDILEKVNAILNNRRFDTWVVVNFDFDQETLDMISDISIKEKISIDEVITKALKQYINET